MVSSRVGSRIQRSGPQRTRPYNDRYDRPWRYFSTAVPSSVQFFLCSACANNNRLLFLFAPMLWQLLMLHDHMTGYR